MNARRLDVVWMLLLLATGITWWVGERHAGGPAAVALVMVIAGIKSVLVIGEFMALRGVKRVWQAIVGGWLLIVLALIALAYTLGMK